MSSSNSFSLILSVFSALLFFPTQLCAGEYDNHPAERPQLIISTDVATGLIDTHGGKSLSPVTFTTEYAWGNDSSVAPQDLDDGLTLAMALNLDAVHIVDVLAVFPTYGNASLAAQMLVARQITRNLKGRRNIPIVPGASGPVSQILHATPLWFDGTRTQIAGPHGSFHAACVNAAVRTMQDRIERSRLPVTILALGPLTDVACLLNIARKSVLKNIKEIIVIGSRLEGESVQINGLVVNDFNFRMDPIAGALFLGAQRKVTVPIRLMSFGLTGQTSQADDLIPFDADSYPGPEHPNQLSERSFAWFLAAAEPRNEFWSGIFGTAEGPFDQYALVAATWPDLFDCQPALAYVQQCPTPSWSLDFPVDDDGNPTEQPYNAPDNPCIDHGAAHGGSLSEVPAQLVVTLDLNDQGALVRGLTGVEGNIPELDRFARPVTACLDFSSTVAREEFEMLIKKYTW